MTPEIALENIMDGNRRFATGAPRAGRMDPVERAKLVAGQTPHTIVFSCVDSRVPPQQVFDADPGELLTIRTAAHVVDEAALGSIEFGVWGLKIPLLLVMGHTGCGAVTAATAPADPAAPLPGSIGYLAEAITPAVQAARVQGGDLIDTAVAINVRLTVERLMQSPVIATAVTEGSLQVVGTVYELATGEVKRVDAAA